MININRGQAAHVLDEVFRGNYDAAINSIMDYAMQNEHYSDMIMHFTHYLDSLPCWILEGFILDKLHISIYEGCVKIEYIKDWADLTRVFNGKDVIKEIRDRIELIRRTDEIIDIANKYTNDKKEEEETMKNINTTEENTIVCAECGCVIENIEDAREGINGEYYCEDCFDEKFVTCYECGEIIERDEAYTDSDGNYYCQNCFEENFAICHRCGKAYRKDDMIFVESEDRWYCEDCIERNHTQCERCDEWVSRYDTFTVFVDADRNTEEWCPNCTDWNTHTCDECNGLYSDDVCFDDDCTCPHCSNSWRRQDTGDIKLYRAPRGVTNYSYKPTPCMCSVEDQETDDKTIYLGFELEVDKPSEDCSINDAANFVNDTSKYTYVKHDGSLDEGMEIVSHPATLEYHMSKKEVWGDIFNQLLTDCGFKSHDARTCGLHVHVSLHALESRNPLAVNNMLFLMDHFWDRFVKFSRRTEDQLNRWAARYSTIHGDYEDLKKQAKDTRNRYYALNLQNKHTVEIRMFRGTLNLNTFIATLQFVDVFAKKCCEISNLRELQAMTWDELVRSDYPELNEYLKKRGLAGSEEEIRAAEEAMRLKDEEKLRAEREAAERRERERQERLRQHREERRNRFPNFPIGSRVRCISLADRNPEFIGHVGTVINFSSDTCTDIPILVHFVGVGTAGHDGHTFDDEYISDNCWYCEPDCLEVISE